MNYYQQPRQSHILPIIGGVIGGLVVLAIIGYCSIALYIKRTFASSAPLAAEERTDRWLGISLPSWTSRLPAPSTIGSGTVFSDDKGGYDGRSTVFSQNSIPPDHPMPPPNAAHVVPPFLPRTNSYRTPDSPMSSAGPATPTSPIRPSHWAPVPLPPNAHVKDDSKRSSTHSSVEEKRVSWTLPVGSTAERGNTSIRQADEDCLAKGGRGGSIV